MHAWLRKGTNGITITLHRGRKAAKPYGADRTTHGIITLYSHDILL
jgi:hypothetical protein